jgi:hypothetical protein
VKLWTEPGGAEWGLSLCARCGCDGDGGASGDRIVDCRAGAFLVCEMQDARDVAGSQVMSRREISFFFLHLTHGWGGKTHQTKFSF